MNASAAADLRQQARGGNKGSAELLRLMGQEVPTVTAPRTTATNVRQPIAGAWANIGRPTGTPFDRESQVAQLAAMNRVYDAVERSRNAIAAITVPAPVVNVYVTAGSVTRAITQRSRAGNRAPLAL